MSMPHEQRVTEIGTAVANAIRKHSTLFLAEGIILVLLGALAIFVPLFATITVTIILGWIFLAAGIVGLITTFRAKTGPRVLVVAAVHHNRCRSGPYFSCRANHGCGVAYIGANRLLCSRGRCYHHVRIGASARAVGALGMDAYQRHHRSRPGRHHFAGLPGTAAWALGLLVGINMVFGGVALVAMAVHARSSARAS